MVIGYLLGSIPFGLLLTRLAGKGDVRDVGSGNIGATNVMRAGGKTLGAVTLVLDALKGAAAVWIAQNYFQATPASDQAAAAGALVGHLYPIWLKFRGGKGVATYFGILCVLWFTGALVYAAVWLATLAILRISSVAGILAVASAPIAAAILGQTILFPLLLGFALLVIWKHRENIARLRAGTETRVGRARSG
ncbi:glycerol-3-phosphate 1-O-acyltransferase PlsY [Sphingomonas sabuli]|uniref:Glycerol-3-phosphate acyltransferase n=1 Tax=Sphingomonas sabuli TaxID=2764186 RepID=A0A7G9L5M4_9SPHN|nr:glycerol-3-phosphate 1-O-acyltransferase PlsY [Sphingomonas sabuli]